MEQDQSIRRSMDELEIRNTIARIALATDCGDLEEYASMFSEDGRLEMRSGPGQPSIVPPTVGRAAILAGSRARREDGITGPGSGTVHTIQTSAIRVSGDKATAQTYVVLYKDAHATPVANAIKIYNDEFVRTPTGWKLAVRFIDPVQGP